MFRIPDKTFELVLKIVYGTCYHLSFSYFGYWNEFLFISCPSRPPIKSACVCVHARVCVCMCACVCVCACVPVLCVCVCVCGMCVEVCMHMVCVCGNICVVCKCGIRGRACFVWLLLMMDHH